MLIDGRKIAEDVLAGLKDRLASYSNTPVLRVFSVAPDAATLQFTNIKKRTGEKIGVSVELIELEKETSTEKLCEHLDESAGASDGIVVQLPLPEHIDFEKVREHILSSHDVDCLGAHVNEQKEILAPVTAAFKKILEVLNVEYANKNIVIIGRGRLVGAPAATFFESTGASVVVCDETTPDISVFTKEADIIVLGAGSPGLLKPDMITEGVTILDAGTSESAGKVVGDADSACAQKALYMTPVPGGVGPVAVAMLFSNVVTLYEDNITSKEGFK